MSPHYQGRALRAGSRFAPPRGGGRVVRVLRMLGAIGLAVGLAHLPWREISRRLATVSEVRVEGVRYLDPARVREIAGVQPGQSLIDLDRSRARAALLLHPRIEHAEVRFGWPRAITLEIAERQPVLLVRHGGAWEMDSAGVLLAPLEGGVVADLPMLTGADFDPLPEGAHVSNPAVRRGLAWAAALGKGQLDLIGHVSEIDVADPAGTSLLLMNGARVLAAASPPDTRELSALRVVLVDLERRGTLARELDLRFRGQVIVRPAERAAAEDSTRHSAGA